MSGNAHVVTKEGNTSLPECPGRRSTRLWPEGPLNQHTRPYVFKGLVIHPPGYPFPFLLNFGAFLVEQDQYTMLPGIRRGRVSLIGIESAEPNFHDIQRTQRHSSCLPRTKTVR